VHYTKQQAAERLDISPATFDRRRREGLIPPPLDSIRRFPLMWDREAIDRLAIK
jgi:predicted site-specific integrase-resolvase